MAIKKVL